ncbi:ABC transporter [Alishewanella longhuensis]|uniref:ABC transporter n=1 Tax=Alishewanella longhuensis TaxID=1091037 RepID=A0ABQ3KUD3_9ALTE|nr:ABC transporter ATP-binding protein [Alishewanella longhuensis]GHG60906.1 ABC transporter [Alishewanella longhuensis]
MSALIRCTNLNKKFGRKVVLHQLSFELMPGDTAALIGPNGAGKTTLFSILCGYLRADSGIVNVLGQPAGSKALFGKLSALPQDAQFDPSFTIAEQLQFYGRLQGLTAKAAASEMARVLSLVDLAGEAKQKAAALSHGMRKRAAIAQAFIGKPQLVLLDEPTAGLDPANALAIRKLISSLSGEMSFLISSHNIFELEQLCNKVLFLDKGVLHSNVHSNLALDNAQYLTLQLEQEADQQLLQQLQQLPGVQTLTQPQKKQLVFSLHSAQATSFDILLLQCLASHGCHYRSLTKGQTLEQKLFDIA